MSDRTEELARRRLALRARCEQQRRDLGLATTTLERHLDLVDRGLSLIGRIASTPILIAAAFGVIAFIGPKRLLRWAGSLLLLTATFRRLTRVGSVAGQ